jgi:hypothetical protein
MAIKRYFAIADNTITNAYEENLNTRGTGSNMGQADILEIFSLYSQQSSASAELARTIIQFPVTTINSDRSAGTIPASGSVSFYIKLYNAEHSRTLPRDYLVTVAAITGSWAEGQGLDMENYSDLTFDKTGSNWIKKDKIANWHTEGGDWYTDASSSFTQRFEIGNEDLELDITRLVEQWVNYENSVTDYNGTNLVGQKQNYGVIIKLSSSYEAVAGATDVVKSYYTKKFFARSSEFFFDRPVIEARWDSVNRDHRGNFYFSSSLSPAGDCLNNLYMYNYVRGKLRDIAGNQNILPVLNLYYASGSVPEGSPIYFRNSTNAAVNFLTASRQSTGVYKATFSVTSSVTNSTYPNLVDVWTIHSGNSDVSLGQIHTGSAITPKSYSFSNFNPDSKYVITMPKLKTHYSNEQTERFRLYVRNKNWSPNIYTKAQQEPERVLIETGSFQIKRISDNRVVIPYGTSSLGHTVMSYDSSGNYFDLDMSMLEAGYSYAINYSFYEDSIGSYIEQPYTFRIRVEKNEY